ncbi:MAG: V-type ATP synthase subunit I [Candidatus Methanogranum gryphiswaldense]|nr:MAG: V-type ATP synthase subunit I [Candidatus Methanogranum sp. U3.2.1]
MDEAVEAFYRVKALHLIDHTTGADGLSIGSTVSTNVKASERLLKVRAMEKELGINKHTETSKVPVDEIKGQIKADSVENAENEIMKVLDKRNDLSQRITELNSKKKNLELLAPIPVDLDLYSGYKTITSIVGSVAEDPTEVLRTMNDIEYFVSFKKKEGGVVAVFMRTAERDKISAVLADFEFTEVSVPEGRGSISENIALTDEKLADLTVQLNSVEKEIEVLQMKHKTFLRASDEQLSIEIEKGEFPLKVAITEYSYIMDAWVPTKKLETVMNELESKLGKDVYVEFQETRGRSMHETEEVEDRYKTVPTKFNNGTIAKEFEYPTKLVSIPKYQEIDPSILIMIFLPMMFGFMIGDCGYAIPFIILGAYGLKVTHHKDWRAIATVLFFGGIWSFVFGFFFFGEALGMHFVTEDFENTIWGGGVNVTWDHLLGVTFPAWFSGLLPFGHGVGKLEAVTLLLKLSVYIGIVHLLIGYFCGYYNKYIQHGNKEAFVEKGGWILSFVGMVVLCFVLTQVMIVEDASVVIRGTQVYIVTAIGFILLIAGVAINFKREKAQSILELPGMIGNILSYTRLAAIGMSKAGMALAFNYIVFDMIMSIQTGTPGILMIIIGLLLFSFLHLVIWTLAILSGGLHALRLQFVELMTKFFEGNGIEYSPLKVKRNKTILTTENTNKEV